MMRIGIVSDTHGDCGHLQQALLKLEAEGPLDTLIHCGDGAGDTQRICRNILQVPVVRGNCDSWQPDLPEELLLSLSGISVFVTHGHRFRVKFGLDLLAETAAAKGARIACFGHTHKQTYEYRNGILLLNPGACLYTGNCALLLLDRRGSFSVKQL